MMLSEIILILNQRIFLENIQKGGIIFCCFSYIPLTAMVLLLGLYFESDNSI